MKKFQIVSFAFLLILFSSCFSYSKFLSGEKSMLQRVAASKVDGTQKIDSLLASSVRLMDAALKPINPVKGGKLVAKYFDQNEMALQAIARNLETDFTKMNIGQQAVFGLNLAKKPYAKQFIQLYPKFRKKYKTVKTAAKFMGFMGKSLGKLDFLLGL